MVYLPILLFALIYLAATLVWHLPWLVGGAYLVASVYCYVAYALDKSAARKGARRTPESSLLMMGLIGGWPGAVLAQQRLRHKTIKRPFQQRFWCSVVLNILAFLWLSSYWARH